MRTMLGGRNKLEDKSAQTCIRINYVFSTVIVNTRKRHTSFALISDRFGASQRAVHSIRTVLFYSFTHF